MHTNRAFTLKISLLVTVVSVLLASFINRLWVQPGFRATPESLGSDVTPLPRSISFVDTVVSESYRPLSFGNDSLVLPDTTAVILNWSRLANVVRIAELLCSDSLNHIIKTVLVWNNSPQKLGLKDFEASRCPSEKLRIHNSPTNLYFHARFIACAQATTHYCFIQDDDYLVWPEVIQALRMRMGSDPPRSGVHLLPPHEKLSNELRKIYTPDGVHTSFAWLGHGTMIYRSMAVDFLALLECLKLSVEDIRMADNYFTILGNMYPETWFDQGVELGGGRAFTIGPEGDERNNRHITKAVKLLQSIQACHQPPCAKPFQGLTNIPYVVVENVVPLPTRDRSPCIGTPCLLEINIDLLPSELTFAAPTADYMLLSEEANRRRLGEGRQEYYLSYPLSYAVDGRPETKFQSPRAAKLGDTISLDVFRIPLLLGGNVELALLVDAVTKPILEASVFEVRINDVWVISGHPLKCFVTLSAAAGNKLWECSKKMFHKAEYSELMGHIFRARLQEDMIFERWGIHEVWLRDSSPDLV